MRRQISSRAWLGVTLVCSSLLALGLYVAAALMNGEWEQTYLVWNLLLAWVPLLFALLLMRVLRRRAWSSWTALGVTVLWLLFLPNAFYVVSDLVHMGEFLREDILFDAIVFCAIIVNGLLLGFLSVYLVHEQLFRRVGARQCAALLGVIFLAASFAIYMGRDLRWNTWDIVLHPASVLFDVSDRILNAGAHPQLLSTTLGFFVLLTSLYAVFYQLRRTANPRSERN